MTPRHVLAVIALCAGCGRVGFDSLGASDAVPGSDALEPPDGAGGDGALDADTDALVDAAQIGPCPLPPAQAQAIVSGQAVRITSFDGSMTALEDNIAIHVVDAVTRATIADVTSDVNGDYTYTVPLGGTPRFLEITSSKATRLTTTAISQVPLVQDVIAAVVVSRSIEHDNTYAAAGVAPDDARGTALIIVSDCTGNRLRGAMVSTSPAVGRIVYARDDGMPDTNETATNGLGLVWLFNTPVGPIDVTLTRSGDTFDPLTLQSAAGLSYFVLAYARGG